MKIFDCRAFSLFETVPGCRAYSHTFQIVFVKHDQCCIVFTLRKEVSGDPQTTALLVMRNKQLLLDTDEFHVFVP